MRIYRKNNPYDNDPGFEQVDLENAIKALNEGRNLDCWPLCSFGWKDADLEPCGCTGISKVLGMEGTTHPKILIEVGGHKTVSSAEEWWLELPEDQISSYTEIIQEIVCGCEWPGYWSGDDWCLHFRETIKVDPVWDESFNEIDYPATAKAIVEAARTKCKEFSRDMREVNKCVDELYAEAEKLAQKEG